MVYESCPMLGGYGTGLYFINWLLVILVGSIIFWGVKYFFDISKEKSKGVKKK